MKNVSEKVAKVFGSDDDDETEEMPFEARMKMRNVGRLVIFFLFIRLIKEPKFNRNGYIIFDDFEDKHRHRLAQIHMVKARWVLRTRASCSRSN